MSWVQVGPHKVNTAAICYVEQEGDTVRIYFHGEWEGNPLDLHFDEAKMFWKHLKAEDVMMTRDKGSATVLPKVQRGGYDVGASDKPKLIAGTGSSASGPTSSSSSGSSSHSSHPQKHSDPKHSEQRRH